MPKLDEKASGVYIIAITPFTDSGELDLESTDRVTDFYLEKGCTGITILGVMGEAAKLSAPEVSTLASRVIKRAGNTPVIVGVSGPNLSIMSDLTKSVMDLGASGVLVAAPHGPKMDNQVYNYFATAAEVLGPEVPWCLMDDPPTMNVWIDPEVINRIIKDIPTCVCLKHEDFPGWNMAKITAIREAAKQRDLRRISILCGSGGLWLLEEYDRGADGAMTGFSYPEMMVDVLKEHKAGNRERAADLFEAYHLLARYEAQARIGIAVRKHILHKRGAISRPRCASPFNRCRRRKSPIYRS